MSQYSNLLAVLLLMIAGCVIDLMMALKCYLVADGIKGREGVQLWFRQRAGVLVGLGVFYLLYAGFTVTLDLIPAGALSPKHNSFVAQIVRLFSMLARYSGAFIVLFVIVGGFVVDLYLAVRSYKGMDDLHGGEARLSWFQQRLGLMIVAGGLYILFVVLFYSFPDCLLDRTRRHVINLVEFQLDLAPPDRFVYRLLHRLRYVVRIHYDLAVHVPRCAAGDLYEARLAPQETFFIGIEDRDERYLRQVKPFSKQVYPDEAVEFIQPQVSQYFNALYCAYFGM